MRKPFLLLLVLSSFFGKIFAVYAQDTTWTLRGTVFDSVNKKPIAGATVLAKDFYDEDAPALLTRLLAGPADVVLSDMAASATGDTQTDHLRIMGLAEAAHDFACQVLKPGGTFVAKVLRGGTERTLLDRLKHDFSKVRHTKPEASRADSAEMYVVGTGFRG